MLAFLREPALHAGVVDDEPQEAGDGLDDALCAVRVRLGVLARSSACSASAHTTSTRSLSREPTQRYSVTRLTPSSSRERAHVDALGGEELPPREA